MEWRGEKKRGRLQGLCSVDRWEERSKKKDEIVLVVIGGQVVCVGGPGGGGGAGKARPYPACGGGP